MASGKKSGGAAFFIGTLSASPQTDAYKRLLGARQIGSSGGGSFAMADTSASDDGARATTKTVRSAVEIEIEMQARPSGWRDAGDLDRRSGGGSWCPGVLRPRLARP